MCFLPGSAAACRAECAPAVMGVPWERQQSRKHRDVVVQGDVACLMHHSPGCHLSHGDKWRGGPRRNWESLPLSSLRLWPGMCQQVAAQRLGAGGVLPTP